MGETLRVGLVGAGRLGEDGYVPALAAAAGVRLAALAEPDLDRRGRVAAAAGVPAFASAEQLLAAGGSVGIDALVLATPAAAHLADARLAAAAGLPLLVEKPPAADLAGAVELAGLEPTPWIGFNRRFDDGVAQLRAAVPRGAEVGVVLEISYRRGGWGAHTVRDDALTDLGPHLVDMARWLTGADVIEVRRAVVTPERAEFDLGLGAARARIRCVTDRPHHERIEVRHRDGGLVGRIVRGGLFAAVRGRIGPRGPHPLVASLTAQLEAFARAVRGMPAPMLGGAEALGTAEDGVAVMAVLDAVRADMISTSAHNRPDVAGSAPKHRS